MATVQNGNQGKYSVKIDNNGHVSGFGLLSQPNNGTTESTFVFASNAFAISSPINSNSNDNNAVGASFPFKVYTTPTYINYGQSNQEIIPAGVYIDDAYIHNAQITEATIGTGTITSANIKDAQITNATIGDTIMSEGFDPFGNPPVGGWLLSMRNPASGIPKGLLWANEVIVSGQIHAESLSLSAGARIKTLQIDGDAVIVPKITSFGLAVPSVYSGNYTFNNSSQPFGDFGATSSGVGYLTDTVQANGGRLLVTIDCVIETVIQNDNDTGSIGFICWISAPSVLGAYGAFSSSFALPNNGSSVTNIKIPISFSGASVSTIGVYNSIAKDYVYGDGSRSDTARVQVSIAGSRTRILSASMTVTTCKR